jgi:starch phosphorylase
MVGYDCLKELALDLRWSWNHSADELWKGLDAELWELTHNPWIVLQTVAPSKLKSCLDNPKFCKLASELREASKEELHAATWFAENHPQSPLSCIAYFSMEFMLSESLPIYSGGLGNVAGDQLKAASDLGLPVVAVGLLYSQGYFRQVIDKHGNQCELYPYNDPGQLPIQPLRKANGEWLRLKIDLPGWSVWLRAWQVTVGRSKLYLLDSNDAANFPAHRGITSELYGGDRELRLKQELLLGIGGWRLLDALGLEPEICHMNEGHSAFAVLERARSFMRKTKEPFEIALSATRVGNLFTTHTAVPAGFDWFSPALIEQYLGKYAQNELGISLDRLLSLGRKDPKDYFNMAYLAIRGSGAINGVSQLHGSVSRHLFSDLFPRWPERQIPVGFVTNGVHMPSWDSVISDDLWTEACGKKRWLGKTEDLEKKILAVPEEKIWNMRNRSRAALVQFARTRLARQLEARGAEKEEIDQSQQSLDPQALTLGFARRFATYKRPNLLLSDPDRLLRIFMNPERPVQLIFAGKAHPADKEGHNLIKQWMEFIHTDGAHLRAVFLSDYDMLLTEQLVQGVDVWINTPRRPWEASGTSGMKVLVNGGLNLSELDGWWAEAYAPEVGWALGDGKEHGEDPGWDEVEALQLYELLEKQIIPEFYTRNAKNIPHNWVSRVRESMGRVTPHFSSNRVVREYTQRYYLPAAAAFRQRTKDSCAQAKNIVQWQSLLEKNWSKLQFGNVTIATKDDEHLFEVSVYVDDLDLEAIAVELFATFAVYAMQHMGEIPDRPGWHLFRAAIPALHPASYFTPRIIPRHPDAAIPLEISSILWQS